MDAKPTRKEGTKVTSSTYYYNDGELVEASTSPEDISGMIYKDEILLLGGKSKRQIVDLYLRGEISEDVMQRWVL